MAYVLAQVALLVECVKRGIPVLSIGGAAAKADPTRLRFLDISEASPDALSRLVRTRLRRYHGIRTGIQVSYFAEYNETEHFGAL